MRYNELVKELQNLTNEEIKPYDMSVATGKSASTFTYKRDNNGQINGEDLKKIYNYAIEKYNSTKIFENDYIEIPVKSEVNASMGTGIEVYNENQTGTYQLGRKLLKDIGANAQTCEMIFALGDSMEPTIMGGDSLLVDTSKKEVYDGKIYCVRIDGQLYAKRLQKLPPDKIKVVSDNDKKYDAFYIDLSSSIDFDFEVIGEIKWWGRVAR